MEGLRAKGLAIGHYISVHHHKTTLFFSSESFHS